MNLDKDKAIALLNRIMELELAGVVRYTHYSLMVYGYSRIPVVEWLKAQAEEGLVHAHKAGELVTLLGGYPSLSIGPLLETHLHDLGDILQGIPGERKRCACGVLSVARTDTRKVGTAGRLCAQPHCPGRNACRRGQQDAAPHGQNRGV